ncbi:hypothetical protein [Telluribacter sp. SYSU D00476]|uniref:hypothetical protein n=1 Tax=Telluribacter sp. SYSU D00476 TaxID=2811430 RepID=UPI001FF11C4E|nr:hypothetical protein [Telluribacter sp. SYSU D00476]
MRYIHDIPHPQYKISLYQWNGKYIIKFEAGGMYEQTYKLDETEVSSPEEVHQILDDTFMARVTERFTAMHADFGDSLIRNGIVF